ncbi:hypothetical protein FCG67_18950 [Rhodococcus oryzae]|uniref:Twin-arginine translocation signal domain-containing protein n=1 Tax=Rhodococcus oryzae TaxID=2571143 RepID=A0ABY2RGM7_9NOCA|nr:bacteriocin fulvocin C-related protein [Rhodococcus oryzae]TJZ76086.1 hypothetical protein FCG67_18950 [Rhodococcus oryzae]
MSDADTRWVLAFDSSCGVCQSTSSKVAHACDHQLEVLPLSDAEVEQWRNTVYGENPPWAPTLFLLRGGTIRAWTGRSMAIQLVRAIGLRSSLRVLKAIGQINEPASAPTEPAEGHISRKRFLRQVAVSGAVASGLVLFGRLPALAAPAPAAEDLWVSENLDRLPQSYDELLNFDVAHRKAIYRALPAENRSEMWIAQLQRYKESHPDLTDDQSRVLESAQKLAGQPSTFVDGPMRDDLHRELDELRVAAIDAFGIDEGRALFAMLGPADGEAARGNPGCGCSCVSDWCPGPCVCCTDCQQCWCSCNSWLGCGQFMLYPCKGTCT